MKKFRKFRIRLAGFWAHPFFYKTYGPTGEGDENGPFYELDRINIGPFVIVFE